MDSHKDNSILNKLNDEEVIRQIPLIIYLTILSISGIAGNSLVCYVFAKKCSISTYHIFITVLSIIDLLTCCVALPLQLSLQFWQYTFDSVYHCKFALFLNTWTTITSVVLLLCVAFDRYRRVCAPFSWQVSLRAAKRICAVSPAIGLACSWISPIIYGIQKREHSFYNITISRCGVTEDMKETLFPLINNIVFAVLFLGALTGIISFYCRITVRVKQQMKWKYRSKGGIEIREKEIEMTSVSKETVEKQTDEIYGLDSTTAEDNDTPDSVSTNKDRGIKQDTLEIKRNWNDDKNKTSSPNVNLSRSKSNRTTLIMLIVSIAFIISYVPLISLLLIRSLNKTFVASLNDVDRSVYKFFLKSYYLNSAVNPVIYGILDARFRKSCKLLCSRRHVLKIRK
ncbi:alpha-2A adrenergic receptor-like [Mercenaria mercenaria]|uniref:alpha-2A adrenergic receptor-like n=1 Tax=Mercenaria mercenaria TaxID=6596 RepID=UPI00234F893B|nr:alpha-2A adrenergic receptor-like [Mercenaria mercenaria]